MCNLLPWRFLCSVTVSLGIIVFIVSITFYREDTSVTIFSLISHTVSITGLLVFGFVKFNLWRWIWRFFPVLNSLVFPDIEGSYEGELISTHGNGTVVKDVKLFIKQTLLNLTIVLETPDLKSTSTIAQMKVNDSGIKTFGLFYLYNAIARNNLRLTQPSHIGGAELEIVLGKEIELIGRYFNDPARPTSGEMKFLRFKKTIS